MRASQTSQSTYGSSSAVVGSGLGSGFGSGFRSGSGSGSDFGSGGGGGGNVGSGFDIQGLLIESRSHLSVHFGCPTLRKLPSACSETLTKSTVLIELFKT